MALGNRSNKDIRPYAKFDARNGQIALIDRVQAVGGEYENVSTVIEQETFSAVAALDIMQVGLMDFPPGAPPNLDLVPAGQHWGDPPSPNHKLGVRLLLKMPTELGGGIREIPNTSVGFWDGVDALHTDYLAEVANHPGQLPEIFIVEVREKKMRSGSSFEPIFAMKRWVPRPPELPEAAPPPPPKPKPAASAKPVRDMEDEIPFS
jgi:hypothetical protein